MHIDIQSLAIFTSLSNLIQVIALFMQYRIDKTHKGIGWWSLASALFSLGFLFNFLRVIPELENISIVANNILFVSAMYFFYWGVIRFFDKKERHGWLLIFSITIIIIAIIFTYFNYNLHHRRINLSLGISVLSFVIARFIFIHKNTGAHTSSNFLSIIFFLFGSFFAFRLLDALPSQLENDLFASTKMQIATYLGTMTASSLWTFGFILLVNQKMQHENLKSKENLKQIFDTNPDGIMIFAVDNSKLVNLNSGFTNLTGFSSKETIGKKGSDINLWKNSEDWELITEETIKIGFINNFETQLLRKDGSQFSCLMSANTIAIDSIPHIIIVIRDITDRKQTKERLRLSEEIHRAILQAIPDEITVIDMAGQVVMTSPSALTMFRYDKLEDQIGQTVTDFIVPEDRERAASDIHLRAMGIKTGPNEYRALRADGTTFDIEINGDYILDAQGQPSQILFVGRDITERKAIDEKLHQSELRYRILVETAHEGIIVRTGNSIKFANTMMQELTGYTEEELLNIPFMDMVYSEDKKLVENNQLKRLNNELAESRYQFRITTKNNSIKWIELSGTKIDWEGESAVLNMITDYTERKQIEVALAQRESSLAEAQRMAHIGNWEYDLITETIFWSEEMYRIYDLDPTSSLYKKPNALMKLIHPDDLKIFKSKMNINSTEVNPVSFEYRVVHKNGSIHHLIAQINVQFDKSGKPVRQIGTVQDITERKAAEKEKMALEQMQQLNKHVEKARENERAAIARDIHDDLGQALTAVKIDIGLIKQKITDQEIKTDMDNVYSMVGDTINAVRRIITHLRPELIKDLGLQTTIQWYTREFAQRNNLNIVLNLDPKVSISLDDSLVVFRIMQESLTNISKHAHASQVDITLSKLNDSIQFEISDDGKGIAKKEMSKITTYGLIGMRERAASLGGTIQIKSEIGHGTIIKLIFPIN